MRKLLKNDANFTFVSLAVQKDQTASLPFQTGIEVEVCHPKLDSKRNDP